MNLDNIFNNKNEKPLDNIVTDGGYCGIFRTIGCIGDSLSSGEMESRTEDGTPGYHDYFDYSWGQFMARDIGCKVYNFSMGGMGARQYCLTFAREKNYWSPQLECQAYIIALGVNDVSAFGKELGDVSDIDLSDYKNNAETFAGYYGQIIQRYKEIQPKAKFFLMTCPKGVVDNDRAEAYDIHRELLYKLADLFDNTYVIDFRQYAPVYDEEFRKKFFMSGHMNAAGYRLTAKMTESYIDYIIRHNMDDFTQIAFVGKEYHNVDYKW